MRKQKVYIFHFSFNCNAFENGIENKKGLVIEPLNCTFPHNKSYACTLFASLLFFFFPDFFLS